MRTSITFKAIAVTVLVMIGNWMYSATNTSNNKQDTSLCLRLKGKISKTKESAGQTYTVALVDNSTIIATQVVKAGKNFVFDARRDRWYGLRIIKSDCVQKLISISTHVPELEEGFMYEVIFEMEEPISVTEAGYLDADAIDFPLALISYEKAIDGFNYSEEYTKNIRTKLLTTLIDEDKILASKNESSNEKAELKNRQPLK